MCIRDSFLILCFTLGGTSQLLLSYKLPIYLLSLCLIVFALTLPAQCKYTSVLSKTFILLLAFFMLHVSYLIPLPASIWALLPGRDIIKSGFEIIETPLPWLPLSLTPENTILACLHFLPAFAVWLTVIRSATYQEIRNSFTTIVWFGAFASIVGIVQLMLEGSSLYIYEISHFGSAVGFFSNSNHQATFLTMVLPFAFIMMLKTSSDRDFDEFKKMVTGLAFFIILLSGIMLTQSLAGYGLAIFVIGLSLIALRTSIHSKLKHAVILSAVFLPVSYTHLTLPTIYSV